MKLAVDGAYAVLDLDYHCGHGTEAIFKKLLGEVNVLTTSLHIDPTFDYPTFFGSTDDNSESNINFPLPPKTQIKQYLETLVLALNKIETHMSKQVQQLDHINKSETKVNGPEVKAPKTNGPNINGGFVIAFGCDTVIDDPEASSRGGFCLQVEDYVEIGKLVGKYVARFKKLNIPTVVVQEGGYDVNNCAHIVANFLGGL